MMERKNVVKEKLHSFKATSKFNKCSNFFTIFFNLGHFHYYLHSTSNYLKDPMLTLNMPNSNASVFFSPSNHLSIYSTPSLLLPDRTQRNSAEILCSR